MAKRKRTRRADVREMALKQAPFTLSTLEGVPYPHLGYKIFAPTPSTTQLLQVYGRSPYLHIKTARQCAAVANVKFSVQAKVREGEYAPLPEDYPLWTLLNQPNPEISGYDFRFLTELYIRSVGKTYWRLTIDRVLGVPTQMWVLPPHWVTPKYDLRTGQIEYYRVGGGYIRDERVSPKEMLFLRTPDPLDPYREGLGDTLSLSTEVETYEFASDSDRNFFLNDATPPGALVVPTQPTDEEIKRMMLVWEEKYGGPARSGRVALLTGGADFKQFRSGRREMDFVDGQRWLRDTIISGVHRHILGITEDVNRASADAAEYTFAKWEILPRIIGWWSNVLNYKIAPFFDPRVKVVFDQFIPEDRVQRAKEVLEPTSGEFLTRNERRSALGYPPLAPDQGDIFIIDSRKVEVSMDGEVRPLAPPKPSQPPEEGTPPEEEEEGQQRSLEVDVKGLILWDGVTSDLQSRFTTQKALEVAYTVAESLRRTLSGISSEILDAKETEKEINKTFDRAKTVDVPGASRQFTSEKEQRNFRNVMLRYLQELQNRTLRRFRAVIGGEHVTGN